MESKTAGMKVNTVGCQAVSINGPKKEGTFDPNNEDDEPTFVYSVPQLYVTTYDDNDKFVTNQEQELE